MAADELHCRETDAELVRRIRRGDDAAFEQLVDGHGRRLFALARSLLGNVADAEDVVQETLAGAFRGIGGFRGRASVKTWLTRILIKRVAKLRRYQARRRAAPIDDLPEGLSDGRPGAAAATGQADIRMDLATVLTNLSDDHRSVIVLRELNGMTYEQIAGSLGVPRGTVESRLFRARQKLKELLKDYLP